jgi:tuftelin-interacting protein 11
MKLTSSSPSQCRRLFQDWDPLSHPSFAVAELKRWRKHFLIDKDVVKQDDGMDVDVFGAASYSNGGSSKKASDRNMTAYETLMWLIWLPRVRSAIK